MQEITLLEYIEKGGLIAYILLSLFTIGVTFMIWKLIHIFYVKFYRKEYLMSVRSELIGIDDPLIAMKVAESIIDERMSHLEGGISTIGIIAVISPLLGLLGTVYGILESFVIMSKIGIGEPTSFAGGISLALITTIMGIIVSVPHYIGHNYLIRNIERLESILLKEIDLEILRFNKR